MDQVYLGVLPAHEPLHDYLSGLLGLDGAVFDSYRLHPQMLMVRYQERTSQRELACKFFGRKLPSEGETPDDAHFRKLLLKEEGALRRFQALGFDQPPYRVPSILG